MSLQRPASGVSAVVLAAGMSRRMGAPKQLLQIEGQPILERTLAHVRESAVDEIVLVLGFAADAIAAQISTHGLKVVRNEAYQQGMGTSLRAGLAAVGPQAGAALIVLADQPFVQTATLNKLIECHQSSRPKIVVPFYHGFRGNPVLLDREVFPSLRELTGDVGCRAIFGSYPGRIQKLPVNDAGILLDIDSPEDMQKTGLAGNGSEAAVLETREDALVEGPELVLVGRDPVVAALAKLGRLLHFRVTVVDPFLRLPELPEAGRILHALDFSLLPAAGERYAVAASRGQFDEEAVAEALRAGISYVALLAGRKRGQELSETLHAQGVAREKLNGIHAPAGLEIGAEGAEEIALSIMAEIVAERRRRH
jgi:molybdenum cofactor cytidylyltransferase